MAQRPLNTQEFQDELDMVVSDLRRGVLKDLPTMRQYCHGSEGTIEGGSCCQNYGFTLETERYLYRLRCNPIEGDYQACLSCFDKQTQQMGLTEKGRLALQNAADPNRPHTHIGYVIENINTPSLQSVHALPLEEALRLYRGLDCGDNLYYIHYSFPPTNRNAAVKPLRRNKFSMLNMKS